MTAAVEILRSRCDGVWSRPAPDIGTHLPGGAFTIETDPPPRFAIGLRQVRAVHGLVTELTRLGHHPTTPIFALIPWNAGIGWAAYVSLDSAARIVAARTHRGRLFGRPVNVRCGPLVRLRAPLVGPPGPRILRVRTTTPLVMRGYTNTSQRTGPEYRARERGLGPGLTSTMCSWLPRRVGLELGPDSVRTEIVQSHGRVVRVQVGGHLGAVHGWTGEIVLRTNAIGHWLLELGVRIGLGGRVAFGFGRITVERSS